MKKLILIAAAIIALGFTSCNKTATVYYYTSNMQLNYVSGEPNNVSELENYLTYKLGTPFYLNKKEAQKEWQSFLDATSNMNITLNSASSYDVSFDRYESQGGSQMVAVENVGKKHWGK